MEPVRIVRDFTKQARPRQGDPYIFIECVQTIFPVNGKATPLSPGATFEYEVPDMYGRPWAQMWEKYHEKNMEKPVNEDLFDFSNNKKWPLSRGLRRRLSRWPRRRRDGGAGVHRCRRTIRSRSSMRRRRGSSPAS